MTRKEPSARETANAQVLAAVRYRLTGGRPTPQTAQVSRAERLRADGRVRQADALHRETFGDAVTLTIAEATAIIQAS